MAFVTDSNCPPNRSGNLLHPPVHPAHSPGSRNSALAAPLACAPQAYLAFARLNQQGEILRSIGVPPPLLARTIGDVHNVLESFERLQVRPPPPQGCIRTAVHLRRRGVARRSKVLAVSLEHWKGRRGGEGGPGRASARRGFKLQNFRPEGET